MKSKKKDAFLSRLDSFYSSLLIFLGIVGAYFLFQWLPSQNGDEPALVAIFAFFISFTVIGVLQRILKLRIFSLELGKKLYDLRIKRCQHVLNKCVCKFCDLQTHQLDENCHCAKCNHTLHEFVTWTQPGDDPDQPFMYRDVPEYIITRCVKCLYVKNSSPTGNLVFWTS